MINYMSVSRVLKIKLGTYNTSVVKNYFQFVIIRYIVTI